MTIQNPSSINQGIRHYRNGEDQHGGVTMAYNVQGRTDQLTENDNVEIAFAFCSPKDAYNTKLGRTIARGRLERKREGSHVLTVNGKAFQKMLSQNDISDLAVTVLDVAGSWDAPINKTFTRQLRGR